MRFVSRWPKNTTEIFQGCMSVFIGSLVSSVFHPWFFLKIHRIVNYISLKWLSLFICKMGIRVFLVQLNCAGLASYSRGGLRIVLNDWSKVARDYF